MNECPRTKEIVELALEGLKLNEICHRLQTIPYTTIADVVRRYTATKRVLIKDLPKDQYEMDL